MRIALVLPLVALLGAGVADAATPADAATAGPAKVAHHKMVKTGHKAATVKAAAPKA